jgi:hypothetical protein
MANFPGEPANRPCKSRSYFRIRLMRLTTRALNDMNDMHDMNETKS